MRYKMGRQASRQDFTRNAVRHHKRNFQDKPMRGGIRL